MQTPKQGRRPPSLSARRGGRHYRTSSQGGGRSKLRSDAGAHGPDLDKSGMAAESREEAAQLGPPWNPPRERERLPEFTLFVSWGTHPVPAFVELSAK